MGAEPDIFSYFDYAKYLRDHYDHTHSRNPWYSYRYIQGRTGVDPGYLFKVYQGKKHLSETTIPKFAELLKLKEKEAKYFHIMVLFAKSASHEETRIYFEKMLAFSRVGTQKLNKESYQYYEKWYYSVIRQILSFFPFRGDFKALANMTEPPISRAEAKNAVRVLEKLGLIAPSDNRYTVTSRFITPAKELRSVAIRKYQQDTLLLAQRALENLPKEERDISTVSVTLSNEGLVKARELITTFRADMLELSNKEDRVNRAYHVNLQLIPVSKPWQDA